MLDDIKYIHQLDKSDALGIAERSASQFSVEEYIDDYHMPNDYDNIVFCGMGGSALFSLIFESWPSSTKPYATWRDYGLPTWTSKNSLVIVSSYSGNTEETLSSLQAAREIGCTTLVIAGGGKLLEAARELQLAHIALPHYAQPRFAVFAALRALCILGEKYEFCPKGSVDAFAACAEFIQSELQSWLPTVPTSDNYAKQLALECVGVTPVIYAGGNLGSAAYKWKIGFNENAKQIAWTGRYPEFNHNEFIGWSQFPREKPYRIFNLKGNSENPRIITRMQISDRLLSGKRAQVIDINANGEGHLQQLVWLILLGDFVTLYTALLNGLDPSPVDLVEKLKSELN
jgi:glucose/mannose-6-phosphate isomerase